MPTALLIVLGIVMLAGAAYFIFAQPQAKTISNLTAGQVKTAQYVLPDFGGPFTFNAGGEATTSMAEGKGSAADGATMIASANLMGDKIALGDLNGDGNGDAVVPTIEELGGSGSFFYLVASLNENGQPKEAATQLLGDRIVINSISVQNGQITVNMLDHGPNDGLARATMPVTKRFVLQNGALVEQPSANAKTTNEATSTINSNPDQFRPTSVVQPSEINVTNPSSGAIVPAGQTYDIGWTSSNVGNQSMTIKLFSDKNTLVSFLAIHTSNNGYYQWLVSSSTPQGDYYIEVETTAQSSAANNTVIGHSAIFSVDNPNVPPVKPPIISSVEYIPGLRSYGGSYAWSEAVVYGSGFSYDSVYLVNGSNGASYTLTIDTPTGNPSSPTEFAVQIPGTVTPGEYKLTVKDSRYGVVSAPYTFTITPSSGSVQVLPANQHYVVPAR